MSSTPSKKLQGVFPNAFGDGHNRPHVVLRPGPFGEQAKALLHVAAEVPAAITLGSDALELDPVEDRLISAAVMRE